jgi:hypothetical protein
MNRHLEPDPLQDRLITFAARIIQFSSQLPRTWAGRHISITGICQWSMGHGQWSFHCENDPYHLTLSP